MDLTTGAPAIDDVVQSTGAFPAQVQAVCAEIVRRCEEASGTRVLPEGVDAAVAKAEREGGTYVSFMSEASPLVRIATYLAIEALAVAHPSLSKLPEMKRDPRGALALLTPALQSWRLEYTQLIQLFSGWVSWEELPESPNKLIYAALDELMLRSILKEEERYRTYAFASGGLVVRFLVDHFTVGFAHDIRQAAKALALV